MLNTLWKKSLQISKYQLLFSSVPGYVALWCGLAQWPNVCVCVCEPELRVYNEIRLCDLVEYEALFRTDTCFVYLRHSRVFLLFYRIKKVLFSENYNLLVIPYVQAANPVSNYVNAESASDQWSRSTLSIHTENSHFFISFLFVLLLNTVLIHEKFVHFFYFHIFTPMCSIVCLYLH